MSRWARPENFGHPVRTPLLRQHYVYRAYDASGDLLYAGCSYDPEKRLAAHKSTNDWYPHMARLVLRGPYTYEVARELEYEALRDERPLWAFGPDRRTIVAAYRRIFNRRLAIERGEFIERIYAAEAHAKSLIPYPGNRHPFRITDEVVEGALAADLRDAATYESQERAA